MPLEERRKKLMEVGPRWGDRPQAHHVRATKPREDLDLDDTASDNDYDEDALAIGDMNRIIEPLPNPPKCRISTSGWTLQGLIKSGRRFYPVPRIPASSKKMPAKIEEFEQNGIPVIIEGWNKHQTWPKDMFHIDEFSTNGPADIDVRNIHDWTDKTVKLSDFIAKSREVPRFAFPEEKERLYGKDADCPKEWNKWLHEANVIPSSLLPDRPSNLLLNQPRSSHVETLMCYIGIGDTFTPCHKDLCASSGQNLMCYTEKGGSSYWFMTKSSDAPRASAYFQKLDQELDHETYVITVEELAKAPFDVYIAEQKLGDLILVPPRSCHQVVNNGGLTVKTSWSRMTLKGLETAYYHELPIYRRVCRPETYRVQSTIHYTLLRTTAELENRLPHQGSPGLLDVKVQSNELVPDMRILLQLFDAILADEYSPDNDEMHCLSSSLSSLSTVSPAPSDASSATLTPDEKEKEGGYVPVTCDFCGADVFQSFFECRSCVDPQELQGNRKITPGDGYVVCGGCYSEGRSCKCQTMDPIQCRPFEELLQHRQKAYKALYSHTGDNSLSEQLDFSSTMGTFKAACQLQRARKKKGTGPRTCILPKGKILSHTVDRSFGLFCKGCHSSKCFLCILRMYKVHSIEALLQQMADETHQAYHAYHRKSKEKYNGELSSLLSSQYQGSQPNLQQQRVHAALTYKCCKPVNSTYAGLGWYDVYAQIHQEPPHPDLAPQELSEPPTTSLEGQHPSPPNLSSKPTSLSLAVAQTYTSDSNSIVEESIIITDSISRTFIASSGKRKRMKFAYVEIISRPRKVGAPRPASTPLVTGQNEPVPRNPSENPIFEVATTRVVASPAIQTPSTSKADELQQAQASPGLVLEAPKSDLSSSLHKSAGLDDEHASPVVPVSRPRPRPLPLPQSLRKVKARKSTINTTSTPTSISGPSINLIDHERSRNSKRRRAEAEIPIPTTNPLKRLRFNKTSVEKPMSLHSRSRPDSSGDQLAQMYNATALHNHTMTQDAEYHDDYFRDEAQATDVRNATPGPSRHRQEKDDEVLKLREEVDSLRRQVSNMSQSQQPPPPSPSGLHETLLLMRAFFQQLVVGQGYPQQAPAYWPRDYPDEFQEYSSHSQQGHRSTTYTPVAPRNQWPNRIPQKHNHSNYGHRFKSKARRPHNLPQSQEYYGYDVRPYESHALELRQPHQSGGLRINERGRKTRFGPKITPYTPRQLERLRYDRPSEASQASRTARYSQPPNDMGNAPIVDATRSEARSVTPNFQREPFESRRSFDHNGYSGPRHETRDHTEPLSPSLDSVTVELSADWEDEYEQDDPVTSEGNVFKDSAMHKAGGSLRTPPDPTALLTFEDPTHNPWG